MKKIAIIVAAVLIIGVIGFSLLSSFKEKIIWGCVKAIGGEKFNLYEYVGEQNVRNFDNLKMKHEHIRNNINKMTWEEYRFQQQELMTIEAQVIDVASKIIDSFQESGQFEVTKD